MLYTCDPSYKGGGGWRIATQVWPRRKHRTLPKNKLKIKRTASVAQVVEHLPDKREALTSTPGAKKRKRKFFISNMSNFYHQKYYINY
jgi:hypothetical protein